MAKTLYLVRHGEVAEEYQNRYIGWTEAPLSEDGKITCSKLGEKFTDIEFDSIFCSTLIRARETIELLKIDNSKIQFSDDIRELHFGTWENLTYDQIEEIAAKDTLDLWFNNPEKMLFENGETFAQFRDRVLNFFNKVINSDDEKVLVVTHGGVLMLIIATLLNLPFKRQYEVIPPRGTLTMLQKDGDLWSRLS